MTTSGPQVSRVATKAEGTADKIEAARAQAQAALETLQQLQAPAAQPMEAITQKARIALARLTTLAREGSAQTIASGVQ